MNVDTPPPSAISTSNHETYGDDYLRQILDEVKTIAMVGASTSWNRPSYFAMKYLQRKKFRVIPVNPRAAGEELLGEPIVESLAKIERQIAAGAGPDVIRVSIGLESVDDIIADLDQALARAAGDKAAE